MPVRVHPHAPARAAERGATEAEISPAVESGDPSPVKHGRTAFRRNFPGPWPRGDRAFDFKQLEVYAAPEDGGWLVVTVIVKFFGRSAP